MRRAFCGASSGEEREWRRLERLANYTVTLYYSRGSSEGAIKILWLFEFCGVRRGLVGRLVMGLTAGISLFAFGLNECNRKVSSPLKSLDLNREARGCLISCLVVLTGGIKRVASFMWFLESTFLV